ncbi:MAG: N-6 DNA methylase [Nanoarchaeota archaeon]|nr:N-6 DNA methylase [Nanoarchaeota archaeon]
MNKERAKSEVDDLVKTFQSYDKKELDSMSEEDIKFHFIEPLFKALGWKREDISKETRILKGRADYIVRIGNQDKLVIEAKKTNIHLLEEQGRQAVSYAHHRGIKFSVLTNFKDIRVYHALSNIKNIDKNLLKDKTDYLRFNCEDFVKDFDRLWLLSRESFEQGEINKLLDNVDKKLIKPIDESILADLLQYREWLSKDLKSKRNYLEDSQIDEIVQILIDRLIFMRSVEDRGLEAKDFLLTIIKEVEKGFTDMNLWAVLKTQFQRFDKTYNSKLFEEGLLEKEGFFDNKVLVKVIRGLYYGTQDHQERYMFDEIPVDLLGSIYEQYLGIVLRGTEKRVKLDLLSRKRKKMGIYYTPSYIVDYIVKNTIGEYTKDKSIDEILDIKVIDPACGSGSFLIKAFQELISIIEERLKKGEKSDKYQNTFREWKGKLSLGEKATILTNCIYGVDLDEKAVELAQLNLLLKILEEETRETRKRILPTMRDNIKNGNSLISDSSFDKAFNWHAQFPNVFRDGGFDVVVGNPPYFTMQSAGTKIQKYFETSERWKEHYRGQSDILYYFYIHGINILKEKGVLGFITSRYWLENKWADKLRKFIAEHTRIKQIIDFKNSYIFEDANIHTLICILEKEKEKDYKIKFKVIDEKLDSEINSKLISKEFNEIESKEILDKREWVFEENLDILQKIKNNSEELEKFCFVSKGMDTGLNKAFIIDEETLNKNSLEKDILKKVIKNSEIRRYQPLNPKKFLVYTTDETDISKFPKTEKYLKKFTNELKNRWEFKKNKCAWFRISTLRSKEIFDTAEEKIYSPYRSEENNFSMDTNKIYGMTDTTIISPKKDIDMKILLAILNSKLMSYFVKKTGKKKGNSIEYFADFLKHLPIKIPSEAQAKKIKELVERIMRFHKEEKSEQDIKNVDYEIDEEIYKLYGMTEEEKKVIEE